jgi:hypothetical protein
MKQGWLLNAALLVIVTSLAAFVALKPRSDASATHRVSRLQAQQVQHIRLERKGDPAVVVERKQNGWVITAPLSARADTFQVERLLAILDATAAHRLPAQDLARFELDQPATRITIDGEQFSYGSVNGITREQYVLAGNAVYALAPRYGAMIPANLSQLISKQLFDSTELPVRLELRGFTVTQNTDGWRVSPPPAELSQDDVNRWLDAWRHAAALRTEPYAGGMPVDSIRMELRDGKKLRLDVLQTTPDFVIGRPDEKLRYHFAAQTAKRLLMPPGSRD